jgi:endonuclease-3 related protein
MPVKSIRSIYNKLYAYFGPQDWWPADTPFEVMVGVILTQSTSWSNVEKAIKNLKEYNALNPHKLISLSNIKLARLIRSAGYYNIKAGRLKAFLKFFIGKYDADIKKISRRDHSSLREELLGVKGIGPESADSILLYALGKPVFVIDAYTKRILLRHHLIKKDATYDDLQGLFTDNLKREVKLFNEYHALIVRLGKEFCLKSKPRCYLCPLRLI